MSASYYPQDDPPPGVTRSRWNEIKQEAVRNGASVSELATLTNVIAAVRAYMDVTAEEAVYIAVAIAVAVASVLHDEEPLWLLLVAASGSGKTEAVRLLRHVADKQVDELTRAWLLSWTTGGNKARRTGLLTEVPSVALVTVSDFSTVVTMGDREARARMFGMLRVVYDGNTRLPQVRRTLAQGSALESPTHELAISLRIRNPRCRWQRGIA